jgi:hypothetical protein
MSCPPHSPWFDLPNNILGRIRKCVEFRMSLSSHLPSKAQRLKYLELDAGFFSMDLGLILGDFTWDLWWTKWHWSSFAQSSSVFSVLIIILSSLHTHLSPSYDVYDSRDQAAHYHTLSR